MNRHRWPPAAMRRIVAQQSFIMEFDRNQLRRVHRWRTARLRAVDFRDADGDVGLGFHFTWWSWLRGLLP